MVSERTQRRRRQRQRESLGIPPPPRTFGEVSVPGNYPFFGFGRGEIAPTQKVRIEELSQMIDVDGHARGLLNILKMPLMRNAKRAFITPPGRNEGSRESEFIESVLLKPRHEGGMLTPLPKVIGNMTSAFYTGFRPFEKVWDPPSESVVQDGFIRLRKLAARQPSTITFRVDSHGAFNGMHQRAAWEGKFIDRDIKKEVCFYYAVNEEEDSDFYGKPFFLPAYYHFDKKHKLYYITHMALAVGALPPRLGKVNGAVAPEDKARVLSALSNLGANSAMFLPEGFEILDKQFEGGRGGLPYTEMIEQHNLEMSKSVLAQFMDIGSSTSGGGFSLSKNHMDLLVIFLENLMEDMGEVINNHVIPELIDWNFGTRNFPRLEFEPFARENRELMESVFKAVASSREPFTSPQFMAQLEHEMALELGLEVELEDSESNQDRLVSIKETEMAIERASQAVGRNVENMNFHELLSDPKFIAFAEAYSSNVRRRSQEKYHKENFDPEEVAA